MNTSSNGSSNKSVFIPLQVFKGNPRDPFAVLTKFGFSLNGFVPDDSSDCVSHAVVSNFVHTSIDAKVEVFSDIADDHVDPTLKSSSVFTDQKVWMSAMGSLLLLTVMLMFPSLGKLVMLTILC